MTTEGLGIQPVFIEDEMRKSYLAYSMSMITARALPDVRDGLKPVHRRVLMGLEDIGLQHSKPTKKCANVVGHVMAKYHPHGDAAIYDTLVRMAQDFSLRYPMIEGQGNFGSLDGDPPAAYRYTECRMTSLAEEMLADIEKDTVDFVPNYDDSMTEPSVLPAKVPFLLLNGSTGIAVGMATNMAPHNMNEVIDGVVACIDNPDISLMELMQHIPGPDFPTGGMIYGRGGILSAYKTGNGKVIVRARAEVEKIGDREQIIITEIPYMVNKGTLLERMADLVREKTIEGISFLRDESDRSGMRIVVGIKKDNFGDVVLNQLYKFTSLQDTFAINNLALVNKQPKQLPLKDIIVHFINHRHEVVTRRTQHDLNKARERAHILEGLKIAIDNIDEIIAIIKAAPSTEAAKQQLMERFSLSEIQAHAILEMKLSRLTGLEREKIENELAELRRLIDELTSILESLEKRMTIIKNELLDIKKRFGNERKTTIIEADDGDIGIEDMIADEDMVITMTHGGYIKRCAATTYRTQARGGKGILGMESKDDDFIEHLFVASAHSYILFFTTIGRCYWLKVYRIPEAGRQSRGKPIVNLISLKPDEKIAAFVVVKEFDDTHFIVSATEKGVVNKQPLVAYSNVRKDGINAMNLDDGDRMIECKLTNGNNDIILGTAQGQAVRFHESAARELGRNTRGVRGIRLVGDDRVVSMIIVDDTHQVLTVTENGYGKRTEVAEYRKTNRGGSGIINIKTSDRNGPVVALKGVTGNDDIMLMTKNGIIIRCDVNRISVIGRNTQGVRLINLEENDKVVDIALCDKQPEAEIAGEAAVVQAAPAVAEPLSSSPVEADDTLADEDEPQESQDE